MIAGARGMDKLGGCWVPLGVDPGRACRTGPGAGPGSVIVDLLVRHPVCIRVVNAWSGATSYDS